MHTAPVRNLLTSQANAQLKPLLTKATQIAALQQSVIPFIPKALQNHCRVINFNKGKLTLAADNSSIASKLRFHTTELLSQLRSQPSFAGIIGITVMVHPPESPWLRAPSSPKKLGTEALQTLEDCVEHTTDPALKQQLQQFLQHQKG